ncbi:MAG TPA: rod shape-determining protein MreC [Terriglobales bacterium]
MENLITRYRNVTILVAVLFAQVLGLAVQVKRTSENESTRLIRVWTNDTISPLEKGTVLVHMSLRDLWNNYVNLRGVRQENKQLKDQIQQLRIEQARLSEDATQAHRLQALLGFKEQFVSQTVAAQVIGTSGSEQSRSVYIDKGSRDGLKQDMAVITGDGVVGKVLRVFSGTSQVLLINDQTSGVGAILEKSRLQGVLRGTANGDVVLEKVMSDEPVQPGDKVLTSGGDQIFPKGLPVGSVTRVAPGAELFYKIDVKPTADLSRLEEVLVVTEVKDREPSVADSGPPMRAADILAARLPTVPDKPATDPTKPLTAAPTTPGAQPTSPPASHPTGTAATPGAQNSAAPSSVSSTAQLKSANGSAEPKPVKPAVAQPNASVPAVILKSPKPANLTPSPASSSSGTQTAPAQEQPQGPPQ